MKFSIIVPTLNNLDYLKILISSIEKNSSFDHEIIIHVNENLDDTIEFLKQKKLNILILKQILDYVVLLIKLQN